MLREIEKNELDAINFKFCPVRVCRSPPNRGGSGGSMAKTPPSQKPLKGENPPAAPPLSGGEHNVMVAEGGSRGEHNFIIFQDFFSAPPQTGGSKES